MDNELHNHEAEESIIASCFLSEDAMFFIMEHCKTHYFSDPLNRSIYRNILGSFNDGKELDLISIKEILRDGGANNKLDMIISRFQNLPAYRDHINILEDKALARTAADISDSIRTDLRSGDDPELILETISMQADEALSGVISQDFLSFSDLLDGSLEKIEIRARDPRAIIGIPSKIPNLDKITLGWQPSDLVIIAGRPSMGKTELLLQCLSTAAIDGEASGIFSLEQPKDDLMERVISSVTQIPYLKIRTGYLSKSDLDKLKGKAEEIRNMPLYIDDSPFATVSTIKTKTKKLTMLNPNLKLLGIDYLQLMGGEDAKSNRNEDLTKISRGIKLNSKLLGITTLALSQLSRKCEERTNKRPNLGDLRESGAIEQDADLILFTYSDYPYTKDMKDYYKAEIIIGKHRNGAIGTAHVTNNKITQTFYDEEILPPEAVERAFRSNIVEETKVDLAKRKIPSIQEEDDLPF